jgi:acid phosphatase type 7
MASGFTQSEAIVFLAGSRVMEATSRRAGWKALLLAGALIGSCEESFFGEPPPPRDVMRAIGLRLSRSWSERDLTAIASRGDLILERLTVGERIALGRGHLRFKVDAPAVVYVAAPLASIPYWLADRGFRPAGLQLANPDGAWRVYRKNFRPGWIGLGVNGLDRAPLAHYAVFVRPVAGRSCTQRETSITLAAGQESCWKTTVARPGVSPAFDSFRPFERLPEELIGAELLQPAHSERHATMLASGRVWKTHVVASRKPDQVAITFGTDPSRELVWTWRTSPGVISTALRLAPVPDCPQNWPPDHAGLVHGDSAIIEVPNLLNDPVIRRHRVSAGGLVPDMVYAYSVGDGRAEGWGPWGRVKTAPDRSRGVRLLYLGDAQTGLEHWGRLLETACRRHPETDFIVLAGDLVDRGNERTNWDHFFLRAGRVFDRLPLVPCAGNHEYLDMGPRLYRAFFSLPSNGPAGIEPGLVYHFECGDTCFAVLDSTLAVSDPDQAKRQARWLDGVLAHTRATWKIVAFHHPVYPSHPWRDTPVLREQWVPVFDKHHVDLVLQGHDHAYLRTYPMRGGRRVASGTIYAIAVSGDKFVEQAPRDYIAVGRAGVATYQTIATDPQNKELVYRAWTLDGRLLDLVRVTRSDMVAVRSYADPLTPDPSPRWGERNRNDPAGGAK